MKNRLTFWVKQHGTCKKKKKIQSATELYQTAEVEVDSGKAIMRVIAQETVFLHRKLETEEILLKVKICRFFVSARTWSSA